jgi:hypothetical protein
LASANAIFEAVAAEASSAPPGGAAIAVESPSAQAAIVKARTVMPRISLESNFTNHNRL